MTVSAPSDLDLARLCQEIYGQCVEQPGGWDRFMPGNDAYQVCWGIKRLGDTDVVVFRGSKTVEDWLRDFDAWADPFRTTELGHVHPGFLEGIGYVWDDAREKIGPNVMVTGHSLGGAHAALLVGFMMKRGMPHGKPPLRLVTFGCPKPGFKDFADLIEPVPAASYCCGDANGHDLVTDVPFSFPPEEYIHPWPLTPAHASPALDDPYGPFRYHHIELYVGALDSGLVGGTWDWNG